MTMASHAHYVSVENQRSQIWPFLFCIVIFNSICMVILAFLIIATSSVSLSTGVLLSRGIKM